MTIISSQDTLLRIGGWSARGGEGDEGFFIDKEGFTGWDAVGFRSEQIDVPRGPGKFPLQGFPDDRTVNVVGEVHAKTPGRMAFYVSQFNGLLVNGLGGRFTAEYLGERMWGYAFRSGSPGQLRQVQYGRIARFQLQLWFPDPRKFGEEVRFAGGVPASHRGNYFAAPVHTITGSTPSYSLAGPVPGSAYTVTRAIGSGDKHVVDMGSGHLFVNGVLDQTGAVQQADTWLIPPATEVVTNIVYGSGNAQVSTLVRETSI